MDAAQAGVESMFKGVVAMFVEKGVQSGRLQVWKEKLQQRGGEIRRLHNKSVTHIFAVDLKFLEDRVGQGNMRKIRAVLLKYEWLEDCLKTGHAVATDPYLLVHESKTPILDESVPSATFFDNHGQSSDPSSLDLLHRAETRKRGASSESDEASEKHRKVDDDWMSVIHKGAKAGVLGSKGTNTAHRDGPTFVADSDSVDSTGQEPSQAEMIYSPPNLNKNITDIFGELRTIYCDGLVNNRPQFLKQKPVTIWGSREHMTGVYNCTESSKRYTALGDDRRSFSYHKANSVLEKLPHKITSVDDVKTLPSIGKSLQENIGEILTTGTLAKLEHLKNDPKVSAIIELSSVWGIGPTIARKLYAKGHRTLSDLMSEASLTSAQRTGLKFHSDISKKIPRHEVQEMETLIRKVAESIDKNVMMICGGSYRRGKALVGDMDMILTHPDGQSHVGFLSKLLPKLKQIDFLTEDLRQISDHHPLEAENAVDTYFGLWKYPGREQRHRIDFKVYPYWKYPYGLIAWTGNDVLNRRLRILATAKGYRLDDQGIFKVLKDADGQDVVSSIDYTGGPRRKVEQRRGATIKVDTQGISSFEECYTHDANLKKKGTRPLENHVVNRDWRAQCKTEREVFDFLGFPWLEPHERNL